MTIKNGDTAGVSRMDLEQTSNTRPAGKGTSSTSNSSVQGANEDSIALSDTNGLTQKALTAGTSDRAARIQQLRQLVATNQYHVDASALAGALIDAHLAGD